MSRAPYGYRYIRKTDQALAAYIVDEAEASVVRRVYEMYTVDGLSIAEITRKVNREGIPPLKASRRERSVVWGILFRQDPPLGAYPNASTASAGCNYAPAIQQATNALAKSGLRSPCQPS